MKATKRSDEIELNLKLWNDGMSKDINANIGRAIKRRRLELGIGSQEMADRLGITTQQLYKYELGTNSIRASKMWKFCETLRKPVSYFYENRYKESSFVTSDQRIIEVMKLFDALDDKRQSHVIEYCRNCINGMNNEA